MKKIDFKQIKPSVIVRYVMQVVAIINQALAIFGKGTLPFADSVVYQVVSVAITAIVGVWVAWKNNDITVAANIGSDIMHAIKDGKVSEEEAKKLLNSADNLTNNE